MASQASLQMFEGMIGVLMPGRKAFLHPYGDDDDNYACDFQMRAPLEEIIPPLPAEDARPGSLHSDIAAAACEVPAASVNESPLHEGLSFRMRGSKLGVSNNRHEMCGWGVHKRPTKLCEFVEGASYHPSGGNETLSSGKKKKKVCPGWLHGQQSQIGSQGDLGGLDSRQKQVLVDRIPETFAVVREANVAHENDMVRQQDDIFGPQRGHSCFRSEDLCESEEEASDPSKSDDEMTTHQQHGEDAEVLGDYIPLDIHDAGMSQKSLSQQVRSKRRSESSVLNSAVHNKESDKHIGNAGVLECPHQEIENDQLRELKPQVDEPGSVATLQQHLSQEGVQHCENDWSEQTEEGREVLGKVFQRSVESSKQDPGNWADLDVESLVRESPLASTSNRGELPSVVEEDSIEQEMIKEEALREAPLSAGEEPPASASNRNNSDVDAHNYSCSQGSHSSPLASEREGTESTGISLRAREPVVLRSRAAGLPPDVGIVVIEDDDDDDDDNNEEEDKEDEDGEGDAFDSYDDTDSDAGSKRHLLRTDPVPVSRPAAPALRKTSNTLPEFSSSEDDSDSDDCQVLSWCPAQKKPVSHSIQRESEHNAKKVYSPESSQCTERENESSDIEIMRGSQGAIRRQWEEAALKRRMGRVMQSEGSKAGRNSRRGQPSNLGRRNSASSPPGRKEQGVSEPAQRAHDTHQQHGSMPSQGLAESVATSTDSDGQIGIESRVRGERGVDVVPCASSYEEQLPDIGAISTGREQFHQVFPNSPRGLQEVPVEIATLFPGRPSGRDLAEELDDQYLQGEPCGWMQNWFEERVTSHRIDGACTSRQDEFKGMTEGGLLAPKVIPDLNIREGQAAETKSEALIGSGIIGEREKMKQSAEFQRADEEEWARRDLELQRQAQEAQKLRKRKRAEADRKMEMENRQKQRLEEIRLLQQQEEWNMGLKEQLRGQVQKRLESLAYGCSDMATLLRRLGIAVEGGTYPSPQEVNSAYKKALLRFHPDRASSLAQGDPQGQVEAEETFKLISRMKNTLSLVSSPTFNSFW